jgi:hypothetical protein
MATAVLTAMLVLSSAHHAVAECAVLPWRPFKEAVRSADQVLVGEVTEGLRRNSADQTIAFRFRVDDVLRGVAPKDIVFK